MARGAGAPRAEVHQLALAFKNAVEPLATHALRGSRVQPLVLRIGSIWGPLVEPKSPVVYFACRSAPCVARRRRRPCTRTTVVTVAALALLVTAEILGHDTSVAHLRQSVRKAVRNEG